MAYRELPPPPEVAALVACLWVRDDEPADHLQRVLPDGCVDVVWVAGSRLVVAGPATTPVLAPVPAGAAAIGVRFPVGAAGAALGLPASELLDRGVPLEALWGTEAGRVEERLARARFEPEGDLARLALDAGYADQAHLTREARRLGGLPPAALLAAGAGPAGEMSDSFKTAAPAVASMAA